MLLLPCKQCLTDLATICCWLAISILICHVHPCISGFVVLACQAVWAQMHCLSTFKYPLVNSAVYTQVCTPELPVVLQNYYEFPAKALYTDTR